MTYWLYMNSAEQASIQNGFDDVSKQLACFGVVLPNELINALGFHDAQWCFDGGENAFLGFKQGNSTSEIPISYISIKAKQSK